MPGQKTAKKTIENGHTSRDQDWIQWCLKIMVLFLRIFCFNQTKLAKTLKVSSRHSWFFMLSSPNCILLCMQYIQHIKLLFLKLQIENIWLIARIFFIVSLHQFSLERFPRCFISNKQTFQNIKLFIYLRLKCQVHIEDILFVCGEIPCYNHHSEGRQLSCCLKCWNYENMNDLTFQVITLQTNFFFLFLLC